MLALLTGHVTELHQMHNHARSDHTQLTSYNDREPEEDMVDNLWHLSEGTHGHWLNSYSTSRPCGLPASDRKVSTYNPGSAPYLPRLSDYPRQGALSIPNAQSTSWPSYCKSVEGRAKTNLSQRVTTQAQWEQEGTAPSLS
jgi:hypothetical protein